MKRGIEQTIFLMFALIVFVIVAFIVIQLFLRGAGSVEKVGKAVTLENAIQQCSASTNDMVRYCTSVFSIDLNGDNQIGGVQRNPKNGLATCETAVFCYSLIDSPTGYECAKELCKYYIDTKKLTPEEATIKVFGKYKLSSGETFEIGTNSDDIKNTLGYIDRYKDKKEPGILFVGENCQPDEVFTSTWRTLIDSLLKEAYINKRTVVFNISRDGVIYVGVDGLKDRILSDIYFLDSKYMDAREVPLCAVLRSLI